ncbi:hypothetical protein BH11GEM1_BH11GEM1_28880 [soil metagenome]
MSCSRTVTTAWLGLVALVCAGTALAQKPGPGSPDVSIRKTGGGSFTSGQAATFTIIVSNGSGSIPMGASTGLTVVDTLPSNFGAPITAGGPAGSGWGCAVAGQVVVCHYNGAVVNAGTSFPILTITAMARDRDSFINCADVMLDRGRDVNPRDNRSCVKGEIGVGGGTNGGSKYDVGVRKSGPTSLVSGQTGTWTLSTINTGPSTVSAGSGVTVVDTLPGNLAAPIAASGAPNWVCTVSGQIVTCAYGGGPVAPGHAMSPISITAVGGRADGGRNCAWISVKAGADNKPADNGSCVEIVVTKPTGGGGKYDVSIRKRGPGTVVTGQTATFILSPNNNGPSSVNNASGVVVTDALPAANFAAPITASGGPNWSCSVVGAVVTCTYIGTAPVGPGPMPAITITAIARRAEDARNCASIALTRVGPDVRPEDNRDCITVVITPETSGSKLYDVSMRKRGPSSMNAGDVATFVLSPNNNGPAPVNSATGIVVTDALPAIFTVPITANGGSDWSCSVVANVVTCTYVGTALMGPGPLSPITVSAVASQSGTARNCATIALTGTTEASTGDNTDCIAVVVRKPPARGATLTVIKIAQPQSTQAFHFATQSAGLSPFDLDDDGNNTNALSNTKIFTNLATGVPYTVTEDALPGWTTPSIQCIPTVIGTSTTFTDQLHRTFTVSMATTGVNMICTVTNVRTGWPSSATVNIHNAMQPFGPQSVDIGAGGTVTFHNVNSGASWTITWLSGPMAFAPVPLANNATGVTIPLTMPGTYTYEITGTPSFTVHGTIIVH